MMPWEQNTDYPYPVGGPTIVEVLHPIFPVGTKVLANDFVHTHHLIKTATVIAVRKIKYHRGEAFVEQVILSSKPNTWFHIGHFTSA